MEDLTNSESKVGGANDNMKPWEDDQIDKEAKNLLKDRRLG